VSRKSGWECGGRWGWGKRKARAPARSREGRRTTGSWGKKGSLRMYSTDARGVSRGSPRTGPRNEWQVTSGLWRGRPGEGSLTRRREGRMSGDITRY
jgi:hypothetical protein